MKKKKIKCFCAVILCVTLLCNYSSMCFASGEFVSSSDIRSVYADLQAIIDEFESIGITKQDTMDIFLMSAGEEPLSSNRSTPYILGYDYDGNPPASDAEQLDRVTNIYEVAQRYYKTSYYEGPKSTDRDLGVYLMYLYISHYIDGPGRAPTANELPHILSKNDVNSYNIFVSQQNMTKFISNFTSFVSFTKSATSFAVEKNKISAAKESTLNKVKLVKDTAKLVTDGVMLSSNLASSAVNYIRVNYTEDINLDTLTDDTVAYVNASVANFNNLPKDEQELAFSMTLDIVSTIIDIVAGSFSLGALLMLIIPNFVYSFTHYLKRISLLTLNSTLGGRMADRVDIEIWG